MIASSHAMISDPDFVSILRTYNDVTARLKRSHETLLEEVQRLRDELSAKNKQLAHRERLAALGEMAAGVAHEIRNPLGGIGLYSSLLERDLGDLPAQRDIARKISAGVQTLEGIVRDILAFAGGAELVLERVSARTVIDAALSQAAAQIATLGLAVEVDEAFAGIELWCDPGQIERALANLIFNAIDAAGEGGQIWVRCVPADDGARGSRGLVHIAVEDNGSGLPPDAGSRIFHPFFTTKQNGTGLGLAIVHRIAESHLGRVTAGRREGGGASVVLSLPARPASACRTRMSAPRKRAAALACGRTF